LRSRIRTAPHLLPGSSDKSKGGGGGSGGTMMTQQLSHAAQETQLVLALQNEDRDGDGFLDAISISRVLVNNHLRLSKEEMSKCFDY
jgi:hypothetical protein